MQYARELVSNAISRGLSNLQQAANPGSDASQQQGQQLESVSGNGAQQQQQRTGIAPLQQAPAHPLAPPVLLPAVTDLVNSLATAFSQSFNSGASGGGSSTSNGGSSAWPAGERGEAAASAHCPSNSTHAASVTAGPSALPGPPSYSPKPSTSGAGAGVTSSSSPGAPQDATAVRVQRFRQELVGSCINLHALAGLAFYGIPDRDNLRAVVWKLLLHYLPPSPDEWNKALAKRRTQYHIFCDELMIDKKRLGAATAADGQSAASAAAEGAPGVEQTEREPAEAAPLGPSKEAEEPLDPLRAQDVTSDDHPLSLSQSSMWNTFFQDSEVMSQVERDVLRTHPSLHFFTGDSPDSERHREEMKRALFLYAKLNPGLRYIQGMNELIAPLYWLFKHDPDPQARQYAEADAFWCFMELISEFRDHFCAQLDNARTGIRATLKRLMALLRYHDEALWRHIEVVHKVDPQYYSFRWVTLLLAQEFSLPDTLRVWDTILSDPTGRMDCLLRICTAMILHVRPQLIQGDFIVIMKTLQHYPPVDINVILQKAAALTPCADIPGFNF